MSVRDGSVPPGTGPDTAEQASAQQPYEHVVTAIVVSHNGERWIGELLAGLKQQRRKPERIVVVDTGSTDASRELVAKAFGPQVILEAPPKTGFGQAVDKALRALPRRRRDVVEWLWLLHDDCAPTPAALHQLLGLADEVPNAAVLGPKLRSWPYGRQLIEMGVTIAGSGKRETGLERSEFDQGQHDTVRDVLAVSTAGMLVRRDVFERLHGFDPRLALFRDDVDFGWRAHRAGYRVITCPDAIVFHAEAGARGARPLDAVRGRPRRVDRTHATYTLLVNCAWWAMPLVGLRMVLGALLRTLGLLVVKWPDAAYDEFMAILTTLARPDLLLRGRLRRLGRKKVPRRRLRSLFPPPWIGIQHTVDQLAALVSTASGSHSGPSRRRRQVAESGPVSEEAESLEAEDAGVLRWVLTRPLVQLLGALILVTLVAGRALFGGSLGGGALLPAPDGLGTLWEQYLSTWRQVELGSPAAAPPYLAVVAIVATLALGDPGLAVALLVLGSVPLAGLTAYLFSREIARARAVRLWASASYAFLPAVTGAVAGGRLGTCVAAVLFPLLALAAVRMVRSARSGEGSWGSAWATGLLLAVITAFVPLAFVLAAVLGVVAVAVYRERLQLLVRVATVLAVVPALLAPWLSELIANPWLFIGEAGRTTPGLADEALPPYLFAFADPGGPGTGPWWVLAPLVAVALVALLRRDRASGVMAAWTVSLSALAVGLVQSRLLVRADWLPDPVPAWPGFAAVLMAAGWIAAIAHSADGVAHIFSQRSFGWRQPTAAVLTVVCAVTPCVMAGWWMLRGAHDPLASQPSAVPAYMGRAMETGVRPHVLVLRRDGGRVGYALLRGDGPRLGDAEVGTPRSVLRKVDEAVSLLLGQSDRERGVVQLARFGVGYIYLPPQRGASDTGQLLDTTPGLVRASAPDNAAAWQVELPAGHMRIVSEGARDPAEARLLRPEEDDLTAEIPPGEGARVLVLAEAFDPGWTARLDGEELEPVRYDGWAQAFVLPSDGGRLEVEHESPRHVRLLLMQGLLALVVIVLSLPTRQRDTRDPYPQAGKHGLTDAMVTGEVPVRRGDAAGRRARSEQPVARSRAEESGSKDPTKAGDHPTVTATLPQAGTTGTGPEARFPGGAPTGPITTGAAPMGPAVPSGPAPTVPSGPASTGSTPGPGTPGPVPPAPSTAGTMTTAPGPTGTAGATGAVPPTSPSGLPDTPAGAGRHDPVTPHGMQPSHHSAQTAPSGVPVAPFAAAGAGQGGPGGDVPGGGSGGGPASGPGGPGGPQGAPAPDPSPWAPHVFPPGGSPSAAEPARGGPSAGSVPPVTDPPAVDGSGAAPDPPSREPSGRPRRVVAWPPQSGSAVGGPSPAVSGPEGSGTGGSRAPAAGVPGAPEPEAGESAWPGAARESERRDTGDGPEPPERPWRVRW